MARKKDTPCADCGALIWRGAERCRPCHFGQLDHGTRRMYRQEGCRCEKCRAWAVDKMREYRQSRKARTGLAQKRRASRTYLSPEVLKGCSVCGLPVVGKVRSDSPAHNVCRPPRNWSNMIQISKAARVAIYERDGWTCQLCLEPVDRSLHQNHRMAATLDHVAPRATTLFPDDSPENLRLAHRACNSARGIRAA